MAANAHEQWYERLELAQEMLPLIHRLHRKNNVVTSIFGRRLLGMTDIEIMKAHRFARRVAQRELCPRRPCPSCASWSTWTWGPRPSTWAAWF